MQYTDNDLVSPNRCTRNHHSLAFQTPLTGTGVYNSSLFPQTIIAWNSLKDSLISAYECGEDSVSTFTSLVRLETIALLITGPGN